MRGSKGMNRGPDPPPLKNYKNIEFFNNTAPDLLESQSYQASIQWWTSLLSTKKTLSKMDPSDFLDPRMPFVWKGFNRTKENN